MPDSNNKKKEKKMMLFLKAVHPSGRMSQLEVECHVDKDGIIMFVTGRRIIRWINEELKRTECELAGIPYNPDTEREFKPKRSWHLGSKNDKDDRILD